MPALLIDFARVNDAAAAAGGKLAKQAIFADCFRALDETDLQLAVRFAAGRPFAATDERVLGVGGRAVSDVIVSLLGLDTASFHEIVVRSGEIGEALARVWPLAKYDVPSILTLRDVQTVFDQLAAQSVPRIRRQMLTELLSRCIEPREAAYVTKIIFGDLRTGVQEGVLLAAIAQAFEQPLAAVIRCQLLVGDLDQVAVLAKNHALQSATFTLFHPIQFMLATPQATADDAAAALDGRAFWAEDKLDGIRAQVHKRNDRVVIYTRTMDRADDAFPEVIRSAQKLSGDFVLDGEIVPWSGQAVLPFAHIQRRLGRKTVSAGLIKANPVAFVAFDILYRDGALLMDRPLRERRAQLMDLAGLASSGTGSSELIDSGHVAVDGPQDSKQDSMVAVESAPLLLVTPSIEVATAADIRTAFDAARARRNEGIVLKDPASPYAPGRRGRMWLKLKTHLPTFDCVITAAEYGHGKRRDSLSDYTFAVWSAADGERILLNVGKAFSGVSDEEIARLTEMFLSLSPVTTGRVRPVPPRVVLEIACDQIQKSDRHASGYAFRFPRIKRVRWDKLPQDADTLQTVARVYHSQENFARSDALPSPPEPTLFD